MPSRTSFLAGGMLLAPGLLLAAGSSGGSAAPLPAPALAGPVAPALDAEAARVERLRAIAPTLDPIVLDRALRAADAARAAGAAPESPILTVIDYALPSAEPRLWVFDLDREDLLFHELVAHGSGSGAAMAESFSNRSGSHQTSLGLFVTGETYYGKNGYSMRMHGLEEGVNHRALERAIVVHGAPYVSEDFAARHGRIGRSWGCPAVREEIARDLIDTIKDGSMMFAHYPDEEWLAGSEFLADGI